MDKKLALAKELHRQSRRKFKKRKIITKGIDDLWAADLLILDKYVKENNGKKYLLVVIDTFSKYLFAEPLVNKTGACVTKAFEKIIKTSGRQPHLLHVDRGKEFVNQDFKKLMKEYNITMYHTFNEEKSAIAERVNRTLNQKFRLHFHMNNNHCWTKILKKILEEYNQNDIHRTIGMPPAQVNKSNERDVFEKMFPLQKFDSKKPKFKIGDRVRITTYKHLFADKYQQKWTDEIFTINKIKLTDPTVYYIKDDNGETILGKFYQAELQKTDF